MDTIPKRMLETILMNCFGHLSHSDAFTDALLETVHRHPALAQDFTELMGRATKRKIEDEAKKEVDKLIDPLSSETEPLRAPEDSSMT